MALHRRRRANASRAARSSAGQGRRCERLELRDRTRPERPSGSSPSIGPTRACDLPLPDSPTTPSRLARAQLEKLTPSTARSAAPGRVRALPGRSGTPGSGPPDRRRASRGRTHPGRERRRERPARAFELAEVVRVCRRWSDVRLRRSRRRLARHRPARHGPVLHRPVRLRSGGLAARDGSRRAVPSHPHPPRREAGRRS